LAQWLAAGLGVELVLAQEAVDRVERGQLGIRLAPAPVADFDRHGQRGLGRFPNPLLLRGRERAGLALVGAHRGGARGKAALLVVIPPIFDRAASPQSLRAVGQGQRTQAHLFQGHRQGKTLAHELVDWGDEGKPLQGERLRRRSR
jgi:hypothetical protein